MVWTDVFQAIVMLMGCLAVLIEGSIRLGGYAEAWRICAENGRIDFLRYAQISSLRYVMFAKRIKLFLIFNIQNNCLIDFFD